MTDSTATEINEKIIDQNIVIASDNSNRLELLEKKRVKKAKAAYNVRNIPLDTVRYLMRGDLQPENGDLVLARVTAIGQHQRIELGNGRRAGLHVGDEIIVCYGARYAPDQFEAYVPGSLEACHLVAAGGIAAKSINRHSRMKPATEILPLGLLADERGARINISAWAIKPGTGKRQRALTVAVAGTSMNAGKTTTAAGIIHTLKNHGLNVAAAKVTGTGAGGDRWKMIDAGADIVLDFTDAGLASTFGITQQQLESTFRCLLDNLSATQPDVIVLEVADGLYQRETAALLASDIFKTSVDELIFAAGEALGAKKGVNILRRQGYAVFAVSGAINASPLSMREAENVLDLPLLQPKDVGKRIHDLFKNRTTVRPIFKD